jgi:hypothetical protein
MVAPVPATWESRINFALEWFKTEDEALARAAMIKGETIRTGWFAGASGGRAPEFDYVDHKLGQLFAVVIP